MNALARYVLVSLLFAGLGSFAQELWTTREATTSIQLHAPIFKDLGITIEKNDSSATAIGPEVDGFAGQASESFGFVMTQGRMGAFNSGTLSHQGGYVFKIGKQTYDLRQFKIVLSQPPYTFAIEDKNGMPWFLLTHAHPYLKSEEKRLILHNMDLELTGAVAQLLNRPDVKGQFMGTANIAFAVDVPAGATMAGGCTPDFTGDVDVILTSVTNLSQGAREPGGRVSLAVSASLRNGGTADVPWFRSISPDGGATPEQAGQHPFLVLHTYQLKDGVFRQIGQSDIKHAFFSVNSLCACAGAQILFVGCHDTYGVGTNLNTLYLAPRDELTAHTGEWQSEGSHFDATPVDNVRDHHGFIDHDNFEHRMIVQESQLQADNSQFFVEAWYVVKDDINIYNSMGFREFTPSLSGSAWGFTFNDPTLVLGSAMNGWVNPEALNPGESHANINTGDGQLRLAAKVTDIGDGNYRYEYALMNMDFDRKVQGFTVPLSPGSIVSNASFFDRDSDGANDWVPTVGSDSIHWQAPVGNALDWGTMFNFGFTANRGPGYLLTIFHPLEGSTSGIGFSSVAPCRPAEEFLNNLDQWPNVATVLTLMPDAIRICND